MTSLLPFLNMCWTDDTETEFLGFFLLVLLPAPSPDHWFTEMCFLPVSEVSRLKTSPVSWPVSSSACTTVRCSMTRYQNCAMLRLQPSFLTPLSPTRYILPFTFYQPPSMDTNHRVTLRFCLLSVSRGTIIQMISKLLFDLNFSSWD